MLPSIVRVSQLMVPLAVALAACGGSGSDDPAGPGNGGPPPPPGNSDPIQTTSVNVQDNSFSPPAILVSTGATVTWSWSGSEPHNVTWSSAGLPNSPTQSSGNFQATMPSTTGELVYYCTLHGTPTSGMRGTIRVE